MPPLKFSVGDKVKHSAYSLEPMRSYYLGLGDHRKEPAKRAYEAKRDTRGTVVAVSGGTVTVDIEGRIHEALDYMFERAEPLEIDFKHPGRVPRPRRSHE